MEELYTLTYYGALERGYHIDRIRSSAADGRMHYHKHYQICYVISGRLQHRQNRKYATLLPGECFVVPPGYSHCLHFETDETEIYALSFDESLLSQGMTEGSLKQFLYGLQHETADTRVLLRIRPDLRQKKGLTALMEILLEEQQTQYLPELSCAPALVWAMLHLLAQAYYSMPYNGVLLDTMTGYNSNVRRCIRYVDVHFRQKLSAEALAKRFGMSRAALCAAFPRYAGASLHRYITQRRILEAQMQIRAKTGMSISQIAQDVGYEDSSTFYRNFVRITGMSPAAYRQQYLQE